MDPLRIDIHPDIRKAETPPSRLYTDPAIHDRQRELVFARTWQYARADLPASGPGIAPFTLLEGALSEPLVLTRDEAGTERILSNVCTHRGALVAQKACAATSLTCAYHGRRFGLDGSFRSAPEFQGAEHFPTHREDLRALALERFGPLRFAALQPRHSLAEHTGDLRERLSHLPFDRLVHDASRDRTFEFAANWALYCDNFLEGLHIPYVHPSLNATIEFESYRTELMRHSSLQIALARPGTAAFTPPPSSPDHGKRVAGYYAWVFPNLMLNFYPWGLSLNLVEPRGVDRTRVRFETWIADRAAFEFMDVGELDRIEFEDEAVVADVQRGMRSRLHVRGRYAPARETAVHHFHRLLVAALA
ncbi:MAG: Rieske 2Fe-2S domain-containing protein [Planctomycetota bacterium]|nr:Rieske 2Fe-2S domain-containing protein [Planctomycetota bacterium]